MSKDRFEAAGDADTRVAKDVASSPDSSILGKCWLEVYENRSTTHAEMFHVKPGKRKCRFAKPIKQDVDYLQVEGQKKPGRVFDRTIC
ncbi:hypothetical protein [Arthrobacter sp. YN]|uniref:hypothetical protein n=1 Tax=Arthrobacter sp. YN TaxID=2020486 RepID=UPI000B6209BE|nr:hypothetical protein [Arthrobacter sp. YN]ASN22268.1 hypothetical protein CGK93_23340 [Arthrobacter sp. YN]